MEMMAYLSVNQIQYYTILRIAPLEPYYGKTNPDLVSVPPKMAREKYLPHGKNSRKAIFSQQRQISKHQFLP